MKSGCTTSTETCYANLCQCVNSETDYQHSGSNAIKSGHTKTTDTLHKPVSVSALKQTTSIQEVTP